MRKLLFVVMLLGLGLAAFAQNNLTPSKLLIYKDAAQITRKGLLPFKDLKTRFALDPKPATEILSFSPSPDYNILYYKYIRDSVEQVDFVRDWRDVLQANNNKEVTLVYEIAEDYDEVSGEIRLLDEKNDLVMLRTSSDADFFIPIDQIRQVMVDTLAAQFIQKKHSAELVEVYVDKMINYIPIEVSYLTYGFSWRPVYRCRLGDDGIGKMKILAILENEGAPLVDTEVELSRLKINEKSRDISLKKGGVFRVGKLNLKVGEKAFLNLDEQHFKFTEILECNVPPSSFKAEKQEYPVRHSLQFDPPLQSVAGSGAINIENKDGLILYVSELTDTGEVLSGLKMQDQSDVIVRNIEIPNEKEAKKEKRDGKDYWRYPVAGSLTVVNDGETPVTIKLTKETFGTKPVHDKRSRLKKLEDDGYLLTWTYELKGKSKKEFKYNYETWVEK